MCPHPHAVARPQCGQRLRLDLSSRHEVQLAALIQQGQYERRFHQGEALADALTRPTTEREVRIVWSPGRALKGEPVGIEAFGVLPQRRIAMHHIRAYG